jgi:hypothetical protein
MSDDDQEEMKLNTSDEEEEEEEDEDREDEEEEEQPVAPARKKTKKTEVSALDIALKAATQRTSWVSGQKFEYYAAPPSDKDEMTACSGLYMVIVPSTKLPPPVQPGGQINLSDRKVKGKDVYSTCFFLGSTDESQVRMAHELKALMNGKPCPLQLQDRLQIFLLPDETTGMKPVFVTLEMAKALENYKENNRIKSEEGKARWAKAVEDSQRYNLEGGWKLIWPKPLFQHHLEYTKKPPKRRSAPTASKSDPPVENDEQLLESSLAQAKRKYPEWSVLDPLQDHADMLRLLGDAWSARAQTMSLAEYCTHLQPTLTLVHNTYQQVVESKREDQAKAFIEAIEAIPKEQSHLVGSILFMGMFYSAKHLRQMVTHLVQQWDKVVESMPITADKDVYREKPPAKKQKKTGPMFTQKTLPH